MVDPNTRQGKRTPVTLKIKFKSETLEQFIERYAVDVSQGGIFIRTKEPLAVGTQMKFEFQLRDASPLIAGEGTVVWTRENDPSRPAIAPGMGVRFDRLADGSQEILERILTEKAKQAPQRPLADTAKPPLFTDTPTRVAPLPMQDALLGKDNGQRRKGEEPGADSHTPLPRPMPFHSDADEFPDEAFEEATKVRALDELIAQTADAADPQAEAGSRNGARADAAAVDAASAGAASAAPGPGGDAPEAARSQPRLLDTSPSPRSEPAQPPADAPTRTRLGVEPARARLSTPPGQPVLEAPPLLPSGVRAVAAEHTQPARMPALGSRSAAPLIILLLVLVAAGGAAVWFFVLRPQHAAEQERAQGTEPPAAPTPSGETAGTSGSAVAPAGSAGSGASGAAGGPAGSGVAASASGGDAVKAELAETVIDANARAATVEIVGTAQTGPVPFTAKLEKGKPYQARITASGFATLELALAGGDDPKTVTLVAKPRVIAVDSEPAGALIYIDSRATGHATPYEVELTAAQAAKKSVRVQLRKAGYRSLERVVDGARFTEQPTKMVAKLDEKLAAAPAPTPSRAGSAAGQDGSATGSGGTGSEPGPEGGAGSGGADGSPGAGSGPAGSGEQSPSGGQSPAGVGSGATPAASGPGTTPEEPEPGFAKRP